MMRIDIGYEDAVSSTLGRLAPLRPTTVSIWDASGLVLAEDAVAAVDSPSADTAMKDGYALRTADLAPVVAGQEVRLRLCGTVVAGQQGSLSLEPGCAIKVMTGAPLPDGADAVVPAELARERGEWVTFGCGASPGRNVLRRGSDVERGRLVAAAGCLLRPAAAGLLAAAGLSEVLAHPRPKVALVATGDEVVAPGNPLAPGQLYASNLVTLRSWLARFGFESRTAHVVPDHPDQLRDVLSGLLAEVDVVLTSGGAWKSERDFTPAVLAGLDAEIVFQRVRLAPGKAVTLGLLDEKAVFCLPGGPPSNEMAFLQLALPGLLRLSGRSDAPFRTLRARLAGDVEGGHGDPAWTSFHQALLKDVDGEMQVEPLRNPSRLSCQAEADALIKIPEGRVAYTRGDEAEVQVLFDR
jgi:molybdopterin molybdotransferase